MRRALTKFAWSLAALILLDGGWAASGQSFILHLKNGDRITGQISKESTNEVTVVTPFAGSIILPVSQIERREPVAEPAPKVPVPESAKEVAAAAGTKPKPPPAKPPKPKNDAPVAPANLEAQPIAATPKYCQHRLDFGLNIRNSTKDQQEFLVVGKSTFAKQPFRHIFDVNFNYGKTDGEVSSHRLTASEKTEYQFSKKGYVFSLIGGGYDKIRLIDGQFEVGPGLGIELVNSSKHKFVWKTEFGFTYQHQFRDDGTDVPTYSARIAEIFAWRVWENLTADAKIEFFPNIEDFGEYRLRIESTLSYPVNPKVSLNLTVIDLYDSASAPHVPPNDLQIRSTLGFKF